MFHPFMDGAAKGLAERGNSRGGAAVTRGGVRKPFSGSS